MKRILYESDFIFTILQQIAIERDARLLPYFSPVEHQLAVAFLAAQKSSPAHSLILRGSENEDDFIFTKLLQIIGRCVAWHTRHSISVGCDMAMAA